LPRGDDGDVRARGVTANHKDAQPRSHRTGLRTIAVFEASKGVLVLLAGVGLLGLIHRGVQETGEELVRHFHLSPSAHYPHIFLDLAAKISDAWLWSLALGSLAYATLRFAEAHGLWHGRRWAEWLGAASGVVYLPFEVAELFKGITSLRVGSLAMNLLVVGYFVGVLRRKPVGGDSRAGRCSPQESSSPRAE
jgi:uncharacterized membrane protein (DUF2068 family)